MNTPQYTYFTARATLPVLFYSGADFSGFRPAGATRFTDQGEIWQGGAPPCQISP